MFVLYVTVLLPVDVKKDDDDDCCILQTSKILRQCRGTGCKAYSRSCRGTVTTLYSRVITAAVTPTPGSPAGHKVALGPQGLLLLPRKTLACAKYSL